MKELMLDRELHERMAQIYQEMAEDYQRVATELRFSCDGCPDNCCDSWFQHHTYIEWAYLWRGFCQLSQEKQVEIVERSRRYCVDSEKVLAAGQRPQIICPLNEEGRCLLYTHRLMVCRTHGVPATMQRPDGKRLNFPGCFRCQELVQKQYGTGREESVPRVERTLVLRRLATLENEFLDGKRHLYPRLQLTIAQMLTKGPPMVATPHCERVAKELCPEEQDKC